MIPVEDFDLVTPLRNNLSGLDCSLAMWCCTVLVAVVPDEEAVNA